MEKKTAKIDSEKLNRQIAEDHKRLMGNREAKALLKEMEGLDENAIVTYKLGYDGKNYTIPIPSESGGYSFIKNRKNFLDKTDSAKYWYTPGSSAKLYGREHVKEPKKTLVICEGEFKRLILEANGIPAITQTSGAGTFNDEYIVEIASLPSEIIICYDNDVAGVRGASKLGEKLPRAKFILLPKVEGIKDVNDFIAKRGIGEFKKLLENPKGLKEFQEEVLMTHIKKEKTIFPPLSLSELKETLGLTIKKDDSNKVITFMCQLTAYTRNAQFNISFNAPSGTGKTYIPLEIASLHPIESLVILSYCSPTAFFHAAEYDSSRKVYIYDLSRKIVIFLDQPHTLLLQHLRPLLSHDKKEISIKITDKTKNAGMRTKNIIILGFPAVIFCSAGLKLDEQEATRFFLMSPEVNQEKIRQAIYEKIRKESDFQAYVTALESNPQRQALKDRIRAIKEAHIDEVKIESPEKIEKSFFEKRKILKPRHARDVGRILSLVKAFALLNLWHRRIEGTTLICNDEDIEQALHIWDDVAQSQELNLPPYVYQLYLDVFVPLLKDMANGVPRQEIIHKHYEIYERPLADWQLRREILPLLEMVGLIVQTPDPDDKRRMLIMLAEKYYETMSCREALDFLKR